MPVSAIFRTILLQVGDHQLKDLLRSSEILIKIHKHITVNVKKYLWFLVYLYKLKYFDILLKLTSQKIH